LRKGNTVIYPGLSKLVLALAATGALVSCGFVNSFVPPIDVEDPLKVQDETVEFTVDEEDPPTIEELGADGDIEVLPDELDEPGEEEELDPDPPEEAAPDSARVAVQARGKATIGPKLFDDVAAPPVTPVGFDVRLKIGKVRIRFPRNFRPRSRIVLSVTSLRVVLRDVDPGGQSVIIRLAGGSGLNEIRAGRLRNIVLHRRSNREYVSTAITVPIHVTKTVDIARFMQVVTTGGQNRATATLKIYAKPKYLPRRSRVTWTFGESKGTFRFR